MRVTNKYYRRFLDEGEITNLSEEHIVAALKNIKGIHGKYVKQGRALLILLYYSGGRPAEILRVRAEDVSKDGNYIKVKIPGQIKNSLPRTIYLGLRGRLLIKELYEYAISMPPPTYLFYAYQGKRFRKNPSSGKEYHEISSKLRYHFSKWFDGIFGEPIIPYYLRHNRFSRLAEKGISMEDLRMIKGAKTFDSIIPYIHLSSASAKRISKKLD